VASVTFDGITKIFPDGTRAVDHLDLEIHDGEFVVLVGPSGCGKTTSLRMVAGLEDITAGEIRIGERVVNDLDARERDIAMVFQNYALYPHMNARENMAFGLKVRKQFPRREIAERVGRIGRMLGIGELMGRRPSQLSGGQRQRVAMGRAIVRSPEVFLMDEPLSNLDAKLRVQMRAQISRIQRELGTTTIYVTHDQVEAMTMGDRVAVMRKGLLQQVDHPQRLYDFPENLFVASFIGSPAMNVVEAEVVRRNGAFACRVGEQEVGVPEHVSGRASLERYVGRTIGLGIRPEHSEDGAIEQGAPEGRRLHGVVLLTEALGSECLAHVEIPARPVLRDEVLEGAIDLEEVVVEDLRSGARERRMTFIGRFDSASRLRPGDAAEIVVEPGKLHFFDLEDGRSILDGAVAGAP
jgi:multiple sugar transport system ATP-binding protein